MKYCVMCKDYSTEYYSYKMVFESTKEEDCNKLVLKLQKCGIACYIDSPLEFL